LERFASIAMLITLVVTLVVGGRLLAMARRTRKLPELLFGIGFVGGGVGQGLGQLGQRVLWTTPGSFATAMSTAMFGFVVLGSSALFLVVWRIYRPGWTFGAGICCAALPLLGLCYGMRITSGDFATNDPVSAGMMLHQSLRGLLFTWASIEAIRYHGLLRKRLVLGLADPVATNQILMWGVASVFMVALNGIISWNLFAVGRTPLADPTSTALILVATMIVSGSMWCAFFPPQALRRWLTSPVSTPTGS